MLGKITFNINISQERYFASVFHGLFNLEKANICHRIMTIPKYLAKVQPLTYISVKTLRCASYGRSQDIIS